LTQKPNDDKVDILTVRGHFTNLPCRQLTLFPMRERS